MHQEATQTVAVVILGQAAHRPRMLNPIGTGRLQHSIPVLLDGVEVGSTRTEHWPEVGEPVVVFVADLHASGLPDGLVDRSFLRAAAVPQSGTWPGPAPLRVELDRACVAVGTEDLQRLAAWGYADEVAEKSKSSRG